MLEGEGGLAAVFPAAFECVAELAFARREVSQSVAFSE
jgi:hypothetical protein